MSWASLDTASSYMEGSGDLCGVGSCNESASCNQEGSCVEYEDATIALRLA